jgi:Flp pilus assembly protein TadG
VLADNDAGFSTMSETIRLLAADVNSAPLNLRTVYQDQHIITQTWDPPTVNVGSAVSLYLMEVAPNWDVVGSTDSTTLEISLGLITGQAYTYRVRAQNEVGIGLPSDPNTVIAARVPDAPASFTLLFSNATNIEF